MLLFKLGVLVGLIAGHLLNQNPNGRAFFAGVDAKLRDFREGVSTGYREREAELRSHTD